MSLDFDEIASCLVIYERNNTQYTRCLCRGNEVQVTGRPEEIVRQAMLYHILIRSGLFPVSVGARAEFQNLDIALYKPPVDERFCLSRGPVVIEEVKRRGTPLPDHESQLFDYLATHRGNLGVLYNGDELRVYEPVAGGGWAGRQLNALTELDDLVRQTASREDPDLKTFHQAAEGCFDSFLRLAQAYGRHTLHRFTFALKNDPIPITGCCFRLKQGIVQYDVYGMYTVRQVPKFHPDQFEKLLSVLY